MRDDQIPAEPVFQFDSLLQPELAKTPQPHGLVRRSLMRHLASGWSRGPQIAAGYEAVVTRAHRHPSGGGLLGAGRHVSFPQPVRPKAWEIGSANSWAEYCLLRAE